ncbi:MAG: acyltransferase family protein [Terricaulis sp.]
MTAQAGTSAGPALNEGYRADIQGLRAIAVLSVVIYHANRDLLGGGFVGVDIFFVISGYLITGILRREIAEGRNSIIQFYRRRVRRLFPALFAMLIVTGVIGWFLLEPTDLRELGRTTLSTVFFVSNFDFLALSNYFGGDSALKPLLHTWSLAVEEQFYIVFPVLLALLSRFGRAVTIATLGLVLLGSLALSVWLTATDPSAAFYLAPPRAFELLIGSLLALDAAPALRSQKWRDGISIFGLVLIVLSLGLIDRDTPFPGAVALAPCLGAAAMLHAGKGGVSRAGRWISNPPFMFFGALSYSLYLWHWPLLVYTRHVLSHEPPPAFATAAVALAIALAYGSWRFVEQPFLAGKARAGHVLAAGAVTMAVGAALALTLYLGDGFPARFPPRAIALFNGARDYNPRRDVCHQAQFVPLPYDHNCVWGADVAPTAAVWGDSFAAELSVALGERLRAQGRSVMEISATLCPPTMDYVAPRSPPCKGRNDEALRRLVADPKIRDVVLIANLENHHDDEREALAAGYRRSVIALLAAGKHVTVIAQIPVMPSEPPAALGMLAAWGGDPTNYGEARDGHRRRSGWGNGVLRTLQGVTLIDPADDLCDRALCRALRPGDPAPLYFDASHLSVTGARLVANRVPLS